MLFKTTEEFIQFVPASQNLSFDDLSPMISSAEDAHIIPLLSQDQYDELNHNYNADTLTPSLETLLYKVRKPLAQATLLKYISFGNVQIGKQGIYLSKPEQTEIVSQWRIEDLKTESSNQFSEGIELMLEYLEGNTGLFPLWAASDSFTEFHNSFINSSKEFNKYFFINSSRRTFLALMPNIKIAEEAILSITGQGLFDELKNQMHSGSLTLPNNKLIPLIKSAIANQAIASGLNELQIIYTNSGPKVIDSSSTLTQVEAIAIGNQKDYQLNETSQLKATQKRKELQDLLYLFHSDYPLFESDESAYTPNNTEKYNSTDYTTFGFGL